MPGAHTHDIITVTAAIGLNGIYFTEAPHPSLELAAIFSGAFLFAGYACAGDLDLNSREYRRWGPFRILWWPYRVMVPHRSWVSHGLIMGGVIRALYLAAVFTILTLAVSWVAGRLGTHINPQQFTSKSWQTAFAFAQTHQEQCLAFFTGFVLAGTTHSLADLISTGIKRRF